ncbi:MAG: right-handed parallel beta-helix repeat-containing protein [Armatimonadia bacterium]
MPQLLELTVGPKKAQITGQDHLALQAAVDRVAALGWGTVRVLPGVYDMGNSLFLRSRVNLVGSGDDTILRKRRSATTRLTDDIDWYGTVVPVADPGIFEVGGGLLLRGKCPHSGQQNFVKATVVAIQGHSVHIDHDPRKNFWIDAEAEAATLFPIVTGDHVNDISIRDLAIDGNMAENENLNGNYGGGIFIQDCDRVTISDVLSHDNNGDGISWQVCDDVTVENCRLLDNADLGLHPGSGSQRPIIRGNVSRGNDIGLFFCWGIRKGLAENNDLQHNRKYGISIGHRDTDNLIRHNHIANSGVCGVLFREHPHSGRDPHRNVLEHNVIENSGTKGDCVAIEMLGAAEDVVLRDNQLLDSRKRGKSRRRIGLRVGNNIRNLVYERNIYQGMDEDVVDLREEP